MHWLLCSDLDDRLIGRRGLLDWPADTAEAVHSVHITDPVGMLEELASPASAF